MVVRAIVWTRYGPADGLQLREVAKPVPKDDEALIRIHATTVTMGDCEIRSLKVPILFSLPMRAYMGLLRPRNKILGQELAGEVESVGREVKVFKEGDQVFGCTGLHLGGYAEYVCLRARSAGGMIAIKPANMTYEEAAAVPVGGLESVYLIREANVQGGEKVLIVGAGGSIGTFAVQLAKYSGAEVTAVDSAGKLDMLRSIGADHVIDYAREDFTGNGQTYDVIFDAVGKSPFSRSMRSLKEGGRYLLANPGMRNRLRRGSSKGGTKRVIFGAAGANTKDLAYLRELIEAGKIRSVIDRRYPLEQVPEAHKYVETGAKKGNVAITVGHHDEAVSSSDARAAKH
jgi:NADPH:quinone reductase-like Zn-dependent oxidoreductase